MARDTGAEDLNPTHARVLGVLHAQLADTWARALDGAAILGLRPEPRPPMPKLVLEICTDGVVFWHVAGDGRVTQIGTAPARDPQFRGLTAAAIAQTSADPATLALACAHDLVLDLDFELPMATLPELERAAAVYVETHTPYQQGDGLSVWTIERPHWSQAHIAITILPAAHVRPVLALLAAMGHRPTLVVRDAQDPGRGVRPAWLEAAKVPLWDQARAMGRLPRAAALAAALVCVSVAMNFLYAQATLWTLTQQAETARAMELRLEKNVGDARSVAGLQRATLMRVHALNELAQKLPNSSWLDRIELKDRKFEISGTSPSAADTLRIVSGLAQLGNAELTTTVTRDTTRNVERFHVSAQVREVPSL